RTSHSEAAELLALAAPQSRRPAGSTLALLAALPICILAGAQFVVSPALDLEAISCCRRYSVAVMPGALTPTEVSAPGMTATLYQDRKSTRLNSSHLVMSYAVFCATKKQIPVQRHNTW